MGRHKSPITAAREQVIKLMYDEGMKYKEIGAVINQTAGYISATVKKMRIQGIIETTRYSSDRVQSNQRRLTEGYDTGLRTYTPARRNVVLSMYYTNQRYSDVAKELGISVHAVSMHIRALRNEGLIPNEQRTGYKRVCKKV